VRWLVWMGRNWRIDDRTADRVLAGTAGEDAVPEAYREVASLVRAARRPPTPGDPARAARTLAAMAAAVREPVAVPVGTRARSLRLKLAVGATAGAVSLMGGLTAAAALSGSVADAVHDTTGVRLPLSAKHQGQAGSSEGTGAHGRRVSTAQVSCSGAGNHGAFVSSVAHSTTTTGEEHGDAVSAAARSDCGKANSGKGGPGSEGNGSERGKTKGATTPTTATAPGSDRGRGDSRDGRGATGAATPSSSGPAHPSNDLGASSSGSSTSSDNGEQGVNGTSSSSTSSSPTRPHGRPGLS